MFEHLSDHTEISELQSPFPGRNVALNILQSKVIKMSLGLKGASLEQQLTKWNSLGVFWGGSKFFKSPGNKFGQTVAGSLKGAVGRAVYWTLCSLLVYIYVFLLVPNPTEKSTVSALRALDRKQSFK